MEGMWGETGWVSMQSRYDAILELSFIWGALRSPKDFKPERDPFCIGNGRGISRLGSRMCRLAEGAVFGKDEEK